MPTIINPIITNAGLAAAQAQSGLGLQLAITHVRLGSGGYTLSTAEGSADYSRTGLVTARETVAVAAGHVTGPGFRVDALFPPWVTAAYGVNEVGFYAGDPAAGGVLFAYWAQPAQFTLRNNIDYLASFAVGLARVPAGSVTVTFDPAYAEALALVNYHEAAADPHTVYVKKSGDTMSGGLFLGTVAARPIQFEDSNAVAHTAWVRRMGRWFAGITGYNTNTVLTAANDVGRLVTMYGAAATFTMPPANTVSAGSCVTIILTANGVLTLIPSGTDGLGVGANGGVPNIIISGFESIELTSNGANFWTVSAGEILNQRTGTISLVLGTTAKPGTIKANGALLSRTAYARLWAYALASGNLTTETGWANGAYGSFASGDGATTFRIPDLRGYHLRMLDDGRGVDVGRAIGNSQADQLLAHSHGLTDPGHSHGLQDLGHNHGINNPAHSHGITDVVHAHGVSDAGHSHSLNDAGHNHSLNNPAHTHTINDPGHGHGVNDAGHTHGIPHAADSSTSGTGLSGADHTDSSYSTGLQYTGVTIQAAASGVTAAAATTTVSANAAGTGITMNNAVTSIGIVPAASGLTTTNAATTTISANAAATGISMSNANTGMSVNNSSGGTEVRVKNIAVLACIHY